MNIGFVGVGRMGANMARRLKDRQFNVTAVYDSSRKAATDLAGELGCAAAQDLSEVTAESDVIFTVVTDDNAMRTIFFGSGDNLLKNARGKLFINCATISPQVHVEVEKLAEKAGAESLEACMASSIPQAREGKLYLMCGGSAVELARQLGLELPLARATKEQYERMIAEGLGELDKSGIAELTFKDRHKSRRGGSDRV